MYMYFLLTLATYAKHFSWVITATVEPLQNGHLGDRRKWSYKEVAIVERLKQESLGPFIRGKIRRVVHKAHLK